MEKRNAPPAEQRAAARFDAALPVELDGVPAQTSNVSATGVYLETDVPHRVGDIVQFTIEFQLHGERHRLTCEGKVVRVDPHGDRVGVAAHLMAPLFAEPETILAKARPEPRAVQGALARE